MKTFWIKGPGGRTEKWVEVDRGHAEFYVDIEGEQHHFSITKEEIQQRHLSFAKEILKEMEK